MNTHITSIAAALLMTLSLSAFASPIHADGNTTSSKVANSYVMAVTKGGVDLKDLALAKDFEYKNLANNETFNRAQYSKFLAQTKGIAYDCKSTLTLLDEAGNTSMAKVTMEFADFTRVDYITLCRKHDEWVISKVVTTYP